MLAEEEAAPTAAIDNRGVARRVLREEYREVAFVVDEPDGAARALAERPHGQQLAHLRLEPGIVKTRAFAAARTRARGAPSIFLSSNGRHCAFQLRCAFELYD